MGLLRMAARTAVISGTATAVSGRVARRQAGQYQAQQQQAYAAEQYAAQQQQAAMQAAAQQAAAEQAALMQQQAAAQAAPPAPSAPAQDDTLAKLTQLGQLHASGVLSDAEFAAAKAKILGM